MLYQKMCTYEQIPNGSLQKQYGIRYVLQIYMSNNGSNFYRVSPCVIHGRATNYHELVMWEYGH